MPSSGEARGSCLEGLVLRDGAGRLYEVPRVVIERYRVTEDRAAELVAPAPAGPAPRWAVHGGIYALAPAER